tara:strand:+ start:309 stop:605 length:297 start_codon:yes stop_codon:yes gene_type:complete
MTRMRTLMARKTAEKRAKGIPIKSWQKRGRKAYLSRLVNMAFIDPKKYKLALIKLEIKDGNKRRSNQVKKRVAERKTMLVGTIKGENNGKRVQSNNKA